MSVRTIALVWKLSKSELGARLVAIALADSAHDDGVTWISQIEIAKKTALTERQVRNCLRALEELGEVETRKVQRGRKRINVYRISLDGVAEPEYDRLPFDLDEPFGRPEDISGRQKSTTGNLRPRRPEIYDSYSRARDPYGSLNRKGTVSKDGASELAPSPQKANEIVAYFVDSLTERSLAKPTTRTTGALARNVGALLREGVEPERVIAGIDRMLDRGVLSPALLPQFVDEAGIAPRPKTRSTPEHVTPEAILARAAELRKEGR